MPLATGVLRTGRSSKPAIGHNRTLVIRSDFPELAHLG